MRKQNVMYPRFLIYKDVNLPREAPDGFTWVVEYFNANWKESRVFNAETAQECWDFVNKHPRNKVTRLLFD